MASASQGFNYKGQGGRIPKWLPLSCTLWFRLDRVKSPHPSPKIRTFSAPCPLTPGPAPWPLAPDPCSSAPPQRPALASHRAHSSPALCLANSVYPPPSVSCHSALTTGVRYAHLRHPPQRFGRSRPSACTPPPHPSHSSIPKPLLYGQALCLPCAPLKDGTTGKTSPAPALRLPTSAEKKR